MGPKNRKRIKTQGVIKRTCSFSNRWYYGKINFPKKKKVYFRKLIAAKTWLTILRISNKKRERNEEERREMERRQRQRERRFGYLLAGLLLVSLIAGIDSISVTVNEIECVYEYVLYEGDTVSGNFVVVDHDIFWGADHPGIDFTVSANLPLRNLFLNFCFRPIKIGSWFWGGGDRFLISNFSGKFSSPLWNWCRQKMVKGCSLIWKCLPVC